MQREREGLGEFRLLLRRHPWWAGGRAHPSDLRHAQPTAPWGRQAERTGAAASAAVALATALAGCLARRTASASLRRARRAR